MNVKPMLLAIGLLFMAADCSFAQQPQPGSAAYNSVYLPAHGVGDTRRAPVVQRWGAVAIGKGDALGWSLDVDSAETAKASALEECLSSAGAKGCRVESVFANVCVAIATNPTRFAISTAFPGDRSRVWIRKDALRQCGGDCKIIREGCSMPSR